MLFCVVLCHLFISFPGLQVVMVVGNASAPTNLWLLGPGQAAPAGTPATANQVKLGSTFGVVVGDYRNKRVHMHAHMHCRWGGCAAPQADQADVIYTSAYLQMYRSELFEVFAAA